LNWAEGKTHAVKLDWEEGEAVGVLLQKGFFLKFTSELFPLRRWERIAWKWRAQDWVQSKRVGTGARRLQSSPSLTLNSLIIESEMERGGVLGAEITESLVGLAAAMIQLVFLSVIL